MTISPSVMFFRITFFALITLSLKTSMAANQTNSEMQVTATVADSCSISAHDLSFGNKKMSSTTILVTCTQDTPFAIGIGRVGSTHDKREMSGNVNKGKLVYRLYQDQSFKTPWGDIESAVFRSKGTGREQRFTVYGIISDKDKTPNDIYNDTQNVMLSFGNTSKISSQDSGLSYQFTIKIKISAKVENDQ